MYTRDARATIVCDIRRGAAALVYSGAIACSPAATTTDASASDGATSGAATDPAATDPAATSSAATSTDASATAGTDGAPTTAGPDLPPPRACNGDPALCDRTFDRVAFPCTHNAFSSTDAGFSAINANQNFGLARQLADGVRCMMLDVTDDGGETALCHGPCALGSLDHREQLQLIAAFLDANPDELLTIIYQDDVSVERIVADLEAVGLGARVYTHATGEPWPTLAAMIDADTRLFVTAESGGPPPAWFHHVWDLVWDTPYSFKSADEFNCDLNRGSVDNDLFLVNHWVNTPIDTPSEDGAKEVNAFDVLYGRATQCQREAGQLPNFLAVDFYDHGDLFAAVRALNGLQ